MEEMVDRYKHLVYGVCRRRLRDPADVEDAVQAVFLILHRKLPGIRGRVVVSGWLYQTAERVCLRVLEKRRTRDSHERLAAVGPVDRADPRRGVELSDVLDPALNSLPKGERDTVVLRYLRGLTLQEVATEMSVPVRTVESRRTRALRNLRKKLEERGVYLTTTALLLLLTEGAVVACPQSISHSIHAACNGAVAASENATILMEGVMGEMSVGIGRWVAGVAVVVIAATGIGFGSLRAGDVVEAPGNLQTRPTAPEKIASEKPSTEKPAEPTESAPKNRTAKEQLKATAKAFLESLRKLRSEWSEEEGQHFEANMKLQAPRIVDHKVQKELGRFEIKAVTRRFGDRSKSTVVLGDHKIQYYRHKNELIQYFPAGNMYAVVPVPDGKERDKRAHNMFGLMLPIDNRWFHQDWAWSDAMKTVQFENVDDEKEADRRTLKLATRFSKAKMVLRRSDHLPLHVEVIKQKDKGPNFQPTDWKWRFTCDFEYDFAGAPRKFDGHVITTEGKFKQHDKLQVEFQRDSSERIKGYQIEWKLERGRLNAKFSEQSHPAQAPESEKEITFVAPAEATKVSPDRLNAEVQKSAKKPGDLYQLYWLTVFAEVRDLLDSE